ncbi:hypothetical protein ACLB2K_032575 [Fragaria x ananassa]
MAGAVLVHMVLQVNAICQMNVVAQMIANVTICILENPVSDSPGHDQTLYYVSDTRISSKSMKQNKLFRMVSLNHYIEWEYISTDGSPTNILASLRQCHKSPAINYTPSINKKIKLNFNSIDNISKDKLLLAIGGEGRFNTGMSNNVTTSIRESAIGRTKTTDRADRATVEKVLDCRTAKIIYKLAEKLRPFILLYLDEMSGPRLGRDVFKDPNGQGYIYIQTDFRFRHGYCKNNPRKMIKTWAEKDMKNLKTIEDAGIRCPTARHIKDHILVMDFIGRAGCAAPLLKEAVLSLDKLREG